jgi:hypothetical protein
MNCIYHIHKIRTKIKVFSVTKQQYFCKGRLAAIKDDVKEILIALTRRRLKRTSILVGFLVSTLTEKSG